MSRRTSRETPNFAKSSPLHSSEPATGGGGNLPMPLFLQVDVDKESSQSSNICFTDTPRDDGGGAGAAAGGNDSSTVSDPPHTVEYLRPREMCSEVLHGWLYLGGARAANNEDHMRSMGIQSLLCVAKEGNVPNFVSEDELETGTYEFKKVPMQDASTTRLRYYLKECFEFLRSSHERGRKTLVYCREGKSRSASVVLAYMMRYERLEYDDAFTALRQRRSAVDPNFAFLRQLSDLEGSLKRHNYEEFSTTQTPLVVKKGTYDKAWPAGTPPQRDVYTARLVSESPSQMSGFRTPEVAPINFAMPPPKRKNNNLLDPQVQAAAQTTILSFQDTSDDVPAVVSLGGEGHPLGRYRDSLDCGVDEQPPPNVDGGSPLEAVGTSGVPGMGEGFTFAPPPIRRRKDHPHSILRLAVPTPPQRSSEEEVVEGLGSTDLTTTKGGGVVVHQPSSHGSGEGLRAASGEGERSLETDPLTETACGVSMFFVQPQNLKEALEDLPSDEDEAFQCASL